MPVCSSLAVCKHAIAWLANYSSLKLSSGGSLAPTLCRACEWSGMCVTSTQARNSSFITSHLTMSGITSEKLEADTS
jgi:hypothetical protein